MSQKAVEIAEAERKVQKRRLEARERWMDWQEALRKVADAEHRLTVTRHEAHPKREG